MPLTDKVILVTGATRGIGLAIAHRFVKEGAIVIGTATTAEGAAHITAALKETSPKSCGIVMNVCDLAAIEKGLAFIEKTFGTVYALVNNAGITNDTLVMRMKDEEWDAVIDTNLKSAFRLSRALVRGMMKAKEGRIINIASVVGFLGNAGQANYCASKAGLSGMTRALARELGSRGITVNCVAPGFIETDMTRALTETQRDAMKTNIPLARFGTAEEIAHATFFLASPEAAYMTGTTLHVNGGMYMS